MWVTLPRLIRRSQRLLKVQPVCGAAMCTTSHFVVTNLTVRQVGRRGYYERSFHRARTVEKIMSSCSPFVIAIAIHCNRVAPPLSTSRIGPAR